MHALLYAENKLHGYNYVHVQCYLEINENPGHLYNILFIGMFELFSEAVRSHYGVQCTCNAEKLVLAVRCLNFPCLIGS